MSKGRRGKNGGAKRFPNRRRASSRHATPSTAPIVGKVQLRSDGSGVLQPLESKVGPVYLPPEELDGVGPGDQVRIITSVGRKGKLKGKIIERLEERPVVSVGVVERMGRRNLVAVPMLGGGPVMLENAPEPRDVAGLAVRVRVTEKQTTSRMAIGEVEEILGDPQDPKVQLAIAVIGQGLPTEFPQAVLEEVEGFPEPNETCENGRRDLRDTMQVTIDGADARDFDDAVGCVEEGGRFRIWVSIADVSHYVEPGTRLDAEAYQRGTSVYFPHAVLPMLPERLSNDLCSLRPEVMRYAMTMEAVVGKDGVPRDIDIYPSLIQSRARLTYEDAQSYLDSAAENHPVEGVSDMVRNLGVVSGWIRGERMERGAVDLDLPESKVVMDEEGRPKDVVLRPRLAAHKLIEDLMIAANEAVARFLEDHAIGGLYRIHESPTVEKLERLKSFLKPLGIRLDAKSVNEPGLLSDIVSKLQETERGAAVQQLVLQSMQQAKYSPSNVGHFGLGSSHYLHFTSPIRRYPDLIVHRALKAYWAKDPGLSDLEAAASWTSARERAAMDAERDIVALASCHVAKERVGDSFKAVVVGVHPAGAFVRPIGFAVDGLVPRESIEDAWGDEVDFDEKRMHLQGYRTRESVTLGDELEVVLVGVDIMLRRIQFAMADAVEKVHRQIGGKSRSRKSEGFSGKGRPSRFKGGRRDDRRDDGGRGPRGRSSGDFESRDGRSRRSSEGERDRRRDRGERSERGLRSSEQTRDRSFDPKRSGERSRRFESRPPREDRAGERRMVRDSDFDGAPSWERSSESREHQGQPRRFPKRPSGQGGAPRGDRRRRDEDSRDGRSGEGRDHRGSSRRSFKRPSGEGGAPRGERSRRDGDSRDGRPEDRRDRSRSGGSRSFKKPNGPKPGGGSRGAPRGGSSRGKGGGGKGGGSKSRPPKPVGKKR